MDGLQEHLVKLYSDAPNDPAPLDPILLRGCAEAIDLMRAGDKLGVVEFLATTRSACEVVAYYELDELVAA